MILLVINYYQLYVGFFMALKTTLEQLEEVQTAISNVMDGQDISYNGKRLTLANLGLLTARENMLLERYNREQGRGLTINHGIPRRD
jgi:hypothetical protein